MEWQGSMNLKRPITINGKPHGVEHETSLPIYELGDEGRVVHAEDTGALWFATNTNWVELTPGGIGEHEHDTRYFTETEIGAMFEGLNGEKQLVDWTNVNNKPSLASSIHGDDSHSETYLKEVDFNLLNDAGLVGPGVSQVSLGSHLHGGYSLDGHTHAYEPIITPLTGFNLDLGILEGTVAEGNHIHDYSEITDFSVGVNTIITTADLADSVHEHTASEITDFSVEVNSLIAVESGKITVISEAPVDTPEAGITRFDSVNNILYIYNGSDWTSLALTVI